MKEGEQKHNQERSNNFEIRPLTPEQHPVTPVPKFTTEFPFFYLTKQKKLLQQDIRYEGLDAYGNPIRWEVTPNRSSKIGVPSIAAHEIFTRLVKPSMELHRELDGQIPEILPLGGIRECLRTIGWKEGGWEARDLLRGLMQIGQASCESDFLLPIGTNAEGTPIFRSIKGIFNRFSIFKIGSTHVSEDDIASGSFKFDFDLDDTLYIQLHRLERDIQRSQDQRYLDNAYMFAIEARGRRWYELLAAKIFGVVKNGGAYCEIKYSWYIQHHHTLERSNKRSRVVSQMNRVVSDHLAAGFIVKAEYREFKDEHGMPDFLIRYYPGKAAKESVRRVLSFINSSTLPIIAARRRNRREKAALDFNSRNDQIVVGERETNQSVNEGSHYETSEAPTRAEVAVDAVLLEALTDRDVMLSGAIRLLKDRTAEELATVQDYVDYWDSIRGDKQPGLLVSLIQKGDPLPGSFETRRQRMMRQEADERRQRICAVEERLSVAYTEHYRNIIDNFIIADLGAEEFERRVDAHKAELAGQGGLWAHMSSALADNMARSAVRAEIANTLAILSFEDFRQREIPQFLADFELSPADFGLDAIPTDDTSSVSPNALYDAPADVTPQDEQTSASEENSLPRAI